VVHNPKTPFAFPRYSDGELANANSASAALNKWLRTHAPEGCVVHSFRHSMRDRLRAVECPKEIIDQIGGWSSSDVGESYGEGFSLNILSHWMQKIPLFNNL
jgi:integrase